MRTSDPFKLFKISSIRVNLPREFIPHSSPGARFPQPAGAAGRGAEPIWSTASRQPACLGAAPWRAPEPPIRIREQRLAVIVQAARRAIPPHLPLAGSEDLVNPEERPQQQPDERHRHQNCIPARLQNRLLHDDPNLPDANERFLMPSLRLSVKCKKPLRNQSNRGSCSVLGGRNAGASEDRARSPSQGSLHAGVWRLVPIKAEMAV